MFITNSFMTNFTLTKEESDSTISLVLRSFNSMGTNPAMVEFNLHPIKTNSGELRGYRISGKDHLYQDNNGLRRIFNSDRTYFTHTPSKFRALKIANQLAHAYFDANLKGPGNGLEDKTGINKKSFRFSPQLEYPESAYVEINCNCPAKPIILRNDHADEL